MAKAAFPEAVISGCSPESLSIAKTNLGVALPPPLCDFYLSIGQVPQVMDAHQHFLPPEKVVWRNEMLVFGSENQNLVYWGVDRSALSKVDPPVVEVKTPSNEPVMRYERMSYFLVHMSCWQLINALPSAGRFEVDFKVLKACRTDMTVVYPALGYSMGTTVDFQRGILMSLLSEENRVYVGARDDAALEDFERRKGVELDWL